MSSVVGMEVVKCANTINYKCGCICEYQLVGQFAHKPEWHIIPCYFHAKDISDVERQADIDWEEITSGVKSL